MNKQKFKNKKKTRKNNIVLRGGRFETALSCFRKEPNRYCYINPMLCNFNNMSIIESLDKFKNIPANINLLYSAMLYYSNLPLKISTESVLFEFFSSAFANVRTVYICSTSSNSQPLFKSIDVKTICDIIKILHLN